MASVIYVQTNGVDAPRRSATPIYLASTAAAMDCEVGIYFTIDGCTLLKKGVAENLIVPKHDGTGAPLRIMGIVPHNTTGSAPPESRQPAPAS